MRDTGRTLKMVEDLPASGSIVVVHTDVMRAYVRRMIGDVRGSEVVGVTKIVVVGRRGDEQKLIGARKPIFVDHAVVERVRPEVTAALNAIVGGVNAMFRKAS